MNNNPAEIIPFNPSATPNELEALNNLFSVLSHIPDSILLAYINQRFSPTEITNAINK